MLPDPKQLKKPTINMGPGKLIAALLLSLSIYIRVFSLAIEIQSNPNDQHEDRRHSAAPLKSSAHYFVHSNHHRDHIDRANGYLYTAPPSNRSSRFKSSQMMATPHQLDQFDDQQDDENGRGTTFEGQILSDYGTTEEHQDTSRLFGHHSQHDAQHIHREQDNNNLEQPSLGQFPDQERTYISREYVREVCKLDRGSQRSEPLNNTYLNYCFRYKLENLLSNEILMSIMHRDSDDCERILGEFIQLDGMINQFDHLFKKLLTRYNCQNGYSVKWSCEDCKRAYRDWLCATSLPFYLNGERIKPCISFCERVEQRCPYLHPIMKEQYGGQPVFICRDPNIPFVPEITPDTPYSEPGQCYDLCHLSDNQTELRVDSLSKYDYNKCPDKVSIAEAVRRDPYYCGPNRNGARGESLGSDFKGCESSLGEDEPVDQADGSSLWDSSGSSSGNGNSSNNKNESTEVPNKSGGRRRKQHVHNKKLDDLREVLAIYKNQPKTHHFGHHVDHSSIDHSPSPITHSTR